MTNVQYMFYNCSSLITLDISNFNCSGLTNMVYIFNGINHIKYIQLKNNTDCEKLKDEISFNTYVNIPNIIVCQDNQIVTNQNAIYRCADFDNYILVKYKSFTQYVKGFYNIYRNDIAYIIYQNNVLSVKDDL